MNIILQKFIASFSDKYSRRKAEELIRLGKVFVNDSEAVLGQRVNPEKDIIQIGDKIIKNKDKAGLIYIKFNKPIGFVSTLANFSSEKNIFQLINIKERVFPIGRLDKNSRGLMILTNDGELTQKLTHPSFKHDKIYEAKVKFVGKDINKFKSEKEISVKQLISMMEGGFDIGEGDGIAKAKKVELIKVNFFRIILNEGKKRQLRRMFSILGFKVIDLKRIEIAGLKLEGLAEGSWQYLSNKELNNLKNKVNNI